LTERALKYDLTIPFARFVAMNHGQLTFPYKRYQVQPVWRADRPQKGRYREFTQCDADVVGSTSLRNEVDLAGICHSVFSKLGLKDYTLKINSRKILSALAEICGGNQFLTDITIAIDKLDKIGIDKVKIELIQRGLNDSQVSIIEKYLDISGSNQEKLHKIFSLLENNENATAGVNELSYILSECLTYNIDIDFTLARGLNYYTGTIFEVKAPDTVQMGSIGGGGRYDNLTELFGVPNIPGVGISFGVDRIYDVMEELNLFPENLHIGTKALFFNMGESESQFAYKLMQPLRQEGISCELFHEPSKMDKQFKYADKKNIRFAVIIGSKEMEEKNAVGYLTFNRPKQLNSFNETMHQEVSKVIKAWAKDSQIRAVVISAEGRGFCAGQDLNDRVVDPNADAPDLGLSIEKYYNPLIKLITEMPKPVICAVNGVAAGAGAKQAANPATSAPAPKPQANPSKPPVGRALTLGRAQGRQR
jgi:histidyl-tRNA synthetase